MRKVMHKVYPVVGLLLALSGCTTTSLTPFVRNVKTGSDGNLTVERCVLEHDNVSGWLILTWWSNATVQPRDCKWGPP